MRVLHLTRDFPPRSCGGLSTAVGGLVGATLRAGAAPAVLSFDDWRPVTGGRAAPAVSEGGPVPVMRVGAPQHLPAARDFAARQRPQLLHVHDPLLWEVGAALRAICGAPAVFTVHVLQCELAQLRRSGERTLSLAGEDAALAGADLIVAPSRAAAAALLRHRPALRARLRVAPHGIDDTPAARAAAAGRDGAGPLLAVGRFGDIKGTPQLIAALPAWLGADADLRVVVAGGLPASPRAERAWRRRLARAAAGSPRLELRGWLAPPALAELYGRGAGLIAASRFETFGLTALEAMLHGVPVAATAAGGLAELIAHGETGLLSAPGDQDSLVANALALASDPALSRRLGRAAAAAARAHCLWSRVWPAHAAAYAELAAPR